MRILIAPQEFKGTLTAVEAAEIIARTIKQRLPGAESDIAPIADGGPGMVAAVLGATGGARRVSTVEDPFGRPVVAAWGILRDRAAVIESSAAAGLVLVRPEERDPKRASSFGVGELVGAALDAGCSRLLVGVGGTATNDGGTGAAAALGVRLLASNGRELPPGGAALAQLAKIDLSARDPRLESAQLLVAADVSNPLCGPTGASHVYGPQKGATLEIAQELDAALLRLAHLVRTQLDVSLDLEPGSGAGGGLGYGLAALCGGTLRRGFEVVASFLDLDRRIQQADVVLTGEGRLDVQTGFGKGPWAIAQRARIASKRAIIFAGKIESGFRVKDSPFNEVVPVWSGQGVPDSTAAARALEQAADAWALRFSSGGPAAEPT